MGFFKKIKKQVRKAVRSPSHSRTASFLSLGVLGKHKGKISRRLGFSRKSILKRIGIAPASQPVMYNSAGSYQTRRISSLMGGAA